MPSQESEDLLYIYVLMRKLNTHYVSLFEIRFLLKQLNERLTILDVSAVNLCNGFVKQLDGGQIKKVAIDIRCPEFDKYFHNCLHKLYDFVTNLHWHEALDNLPDSESVVDLEFIKAFMVFQQKYFVTSSNKRSSPPVGRRVHFKDTGMKPTRPQDLADNQSVFALDLLIFAINVYLQRLMETLLAVRDDLDSDIDLIFKTKTKIRAKQLLIIARRIKIYNDAHLTVLDHISEIKRIYLIRLLGGTVLAHDSNKLLRNYKQPRLNAYIRRIGLDIEVKILARLIEKCLQIFFNLIVSEINQSPIREEQGRRTNITNFIAGWFYYKKSNLSSESSRVLDHMDHLGEFMRQFISNIANRLRQEQQLRYLFEAVSLGLSQSFHIISMKLEQQLSQRMKTVESLDSIIMRIRCLKFLHIMTLADKIIASEAARFKLDLHEGFSLDKSISSFKRLISGHDSPAPEARE